MCGYLNMNDKRGENRALELGVGYSSEGKGILAVGGQGILQSHVTHIKPHVGDLLRKMQEGAYICSGNRELSRR